MINLKNNIMKKEILKRHYCSKCGQKGVAKIFPNEKFFNTTMYGGNWRNPAYSDETGEKLYLVSIECPTIEKKKFLFWTKNVRHSILDIKSDITHSEAKEIADNQNK